MLIWVKKNYLYFFGYISICLFFLFFIFNTSSGGITFFNLIKINKKIDKLEIVLKDLEKIEEKLYLKINLINDNDLDPDYISELANERLGLIKPNRVIVRIDK